jgi:hypothetical protein
MIVTVTLNPADDVTYEVASMNPGDEHRVSRVRRRPGAKGVNVAAALAQLGEPVVATGLADEEFANHAEELGLQTAFVHGLPPGAKDRRSRRAGAPIERRNDPSVDGARTPPNSSGMAPWRSRSMSSIESAPAAIPATKQATLTSGYLPARAAIWTCRRASACSPARSAKAITGTSPARDTRSGSSNDAEIFSGSCNNRTCEVSSQPGTWKLHQLPSSQFRGHLSHRRARTDPFYAVD